MTFYSSLECFLIYHTYLSPTGLENKPYFILSFISKRDMFSIKKTIHDTSPSVVKHCHLFRNNNFKINFFLPVCQSSCVSSFVMTTFTSSSNKTKHHRSPSLHLSSLTKQTKAPKNLYRKKGTCTDETNATKKRSPRTTKIFHDTL